jgi:hypothetical protein
MSGDDDELDNAVPLTPAEKAVSFFKGEEDNPIKPKEVTEEILARLYDNLEEAKQLEKLIEMDKKDIKELAAGLESVQKGKYVVFLTVKKGRKTVKWDKLAKDMIGKLTEADMEKYTDVGEESVSLSVRKVT